MYAVRASATIQESPAKIEISWPAQTTGGHGFTVNRKRKDESKWTPLATLAITATNYTDGDVKVGDAWEYQIVKVARPDASVEENAYAYVFAGIRAPMIESRGKIILLVDRTFASNLSAELLRLQQDLVGDGWIVSRHDVERAATPPQVKQIITTDYHADEKNVRALLIIGHVAAPRSGLQNPDDHEQHLGAWTADTYYADMDGVWTDTTVDNSSAPLVTNESTKNVPGDGKFDQSEVPAPVKLEVGRVDFANLSSSFPGKSEQQLIQQYLNKDHNYRHQLLPIPAARGLIRDGFGILIEQGHVRGMAANGWWNFASLFGNNKVITCAPDTFFSALDKDDYYWAYGCGPGSDVSAASVGSSGQFKDHDINAVFLMLAGSYHGDYDRPENFMRSSLGSTTHTLSCVWGYTPNWFFHHMALGETIGYGVRLSINNQIYQPIGPNPHAIHMALLGDPTLRMYPVKPVSNLIGLIVGNGVKLSWTASADGDIQGYAIYRSTSADGPFKRLNAALITETSYLDDSFSSGSQTYMVRAVQLKPNQAFPNSSTYYNPSQGVFATIAVNKASP